MLFFYPELMFYFLETVKKIFPNSTNESARKSIGKALKHVPRRGKRKHQSITVEKDNNTDVINDGDISDDGESNDDGDVTDEEA